MRPLMILTLLSTLTLSACASQAPLQPMLPVRPVLAQPAPQLVNPVNPVNQSFRTSMSGLIGEEVELSGIYSSSRTGAMLLLRSGEQLLLSDAGRVLIQLPGLENRTAVRIRGRIQSLAGGQLSLSIKQVVRV